MQLLLIRHAIAEEPEIFALSGRPDAERPLTEFGRRRMLKNVRGLRRVVPVIDLLVSSPYVRARETATIVSAALGIPEAPNSDLLTPARHPSEFLAWLGQQGENLVLAAVGHEPHLGRLASWLLSGQEESFVVLKKGGACFLDLGEAPAAGRATLLWLLAPAHLRAMAD
jgi:phosphohistidine phosphatase